MVPVAEIIKVDSFTGFMGADAPMETAMPQETDKGAGVPAARFMGAVALM